MMIQRNVELQLQALDLIERRQNSLQTDEDEQTNDIIAKDISGLSADVTQQEIQYVLVFNDFLNFFF